MKKLFLALMIVPLLLGSCKNRINNDEVEIENTETEVIDRSVNPYISEKQAEETPVEAENLSGEVIVLSASDFEKKVTEIYNDKGFRYKGYTPCIVDFYANWCQPCMRMKPVFEKLAKKYKGQVIFYQINVDNARDICDVFDIENIPTMMFFNRSDAPRRMVGAMSETELDNAIQEFLK